MNEKIKGFRIDEETWIQFKGLCILKHTSPEKELSSFVTKYIKNNSPLNPSLITKLKRLIIKSLDKEKLKYV